MTRTCDIIFRADDSPICTMTINITENDPNRIILNDLQHYFVNYNFKFSNGFEVVSIAEFITSLEIKSNPFYNNKQLGTRYFSGIVLTASWLYSRFIFTSDITFKTTATSYAYAAVAPTGGTSFEIQKNGVSFGSISFAGASNTGVVAVGADTSFTAGDQLSIVGPVTPDGTIDQIAITLLGELTL